MLIKEMPVTERPRERLLKYGSNALGSDELLAIILKNGTKGISSKELALQVLKKIKNFKNLQELNIHIFDNIKGLGTVKKIELIAVLELGKRIYLENIIEEKEKYNNPKIIYENSKHLFIGLKQEYFYCLYLDTKKNLIERKLLFMGTIDRSLIHPREVFKNAYLCSATSFICLHNHPSGDVMPSKADIEITKSLIKIGRLQGIDLIDHIIMSENNYFSFYENNLME